MEPMYMYDHLVANGVVCPDKDLTSEMMKTCPRGMCCDIILRKVLRLKDSNKLQSFVDTFGELKQEDVVLLLSKDSLTGFSQMDVCGKIKTNCE